MPRLRGSMRRIAARVPGDVYADLLRAVPGMNVIQTSARDMNLTSRQATSTLNNSQLVLVDGRRFVYGGNGGDTSVDVNMIPMSVVDRVEVVGVGASTIYGSDAIGGVVNLITREDYAGAEISGSYTTNDHSDGTVYDLQFVAALVAAPGEARHHDVGDDRQLRRGHMQAFEHLAQRALADLGEVVDLGRTETVDVHLWKIPPHVL